MLLHHTSCNFLGKVTAAKEIIYSTFAIVLLSVAAIVFIVILVYIVIKHFVNKVRTH